MRPHLALTSALLIAPLSTPAEASCTPSDGVLGSPSLSCTATPPANTDYRQWVSTVWFDSAIGTISTNFELLFRQQGYQYDFFLGVARIYDNWGPSGSYTDYTYLRTFSAANVNSSREGYNDGYELGDFKPGSTYRSGNVTDGVNAAFGHLTADLRAIVTVPGGFRLDYAYLFQFVETVCFHAPAGTCSNRLDQDFQIGSRSVFVQTHAVPAPTAGSGAAALLAGLAAVLIRRRRRGGRLATDGLGPEPA